MEKHTFATIFSFIVILLLSTISDGFAQYNFKNSEIFQYQKNEIDWGLHYYAGTEREETRTGLWREYEELNSNAAKFQFKNLFWNFQETKQERIEFNLEAGPLWGNGNWIDSSAVANIEADHNIFGLRTNASANYSSRFYYNKKNYTLVQINGWARYDLYNQNSNGISTDSDNVVTDFEEKTKEDKFRFSVDARAGWGIGRLEPMNHFMVADYLLKKYYSERSFSHDDISKFAREIARIKHLRNIKTGHKTDVESAQMQEYLNQKMILIPVNSMEEEWKTGEFLPRFNGNRVEFGPFFKYYNQEPDFIYGGYLLYDNAKYCTARWNRNFSAGVNYNAYKKQDWVLAELSIGWSYFIKLKSQFDFGMKYIPGIAFSGSGNNHTLNNGFIPYVGYFTQIDSKNRVDIKLSYRISEDEKLMLSGPEFSVSVYRSRY
ncbi:MAG TPA: hypothetical protein VLQ91_11480 [Draconibacterium sp.]|nr:hypothetical protein [Draconibacterium sp.]